ncbi:sensor histidine kinase [Streptacidiphilus sp. N1-12]|uniref:Sensor histidine kinase n=2 Tax=Streptacidiphilus alkalitolerans TaxID=3342712 RepID=A0ABV6WSP3_9ACTN
MIPAGPALGPAGITARHRTAWRRAGTVAAVLLLLFLVCLEGVVLHDQPEWPHAVVWGCGLAVALCVLPLARPSLVARGYAAVALSGGVTLAMIVGQHPQRVWGIGEALALLVLLGGVVRGVGAGTAVVLGPLLATTAIAVPMRDDDPGRFTLLVAALTAAVSAYSLALRMADAARVQQVARVRADERTELARELHDLVAHHITGIVVQAKAAGFAGVGPEAAARVFAQIDQQGSEALAAMRRLVVVLREAPAGTAPVAGLAELEVLAEGFRRTGPPVTLDVDPALADTLPPEVAAAIHRITREALTNIRKHAADATLVAVTVRRVPGAVQVSVTDNGTTAAPLRPRAAGGGFGLVGMGERATALGGTLEAGPRPDGEAGWSTVATFPVSAAGRRPSRDV